MNEKPREEEKTIPDRRERRSEGESQIRGHHSLSLGRKKVCVCSEREGVREERQKERGRGVAEADGTVGNVGTLHDWEPARALWSPIFTEQRKKVTLTRRLLLLLLLLSLLLLLLLHPLAPLTMDFPATTFEFFFSLSRQRGCSNPRECASSSFFKEG